jgi:DNA-directed RNA polymerase specialized sigma24 family protein
METAEGAFTEGFPAELAAVRIFGPGAEPLPGFSQAVLAALDTIDTCERLVFLKRLEGKTLEEVGRELNISREKARQWEARAARRLRRQTVKHVRRESLLPPVIY